MKLSSQVLTHFSVVCLCDSLRKRSLFGPTGIHETPPTAACTTFSSELPQIVAPIALYPYALVAQVLAGVKNFVIRRDCQADRWMQSLPT